ncbi:uncharacterized protein [Bemisia tabaci]|uniref:uncharacterized protein n=1 Tax=Bemisia tabaci TaxID=7038 RepID=UPI003B289C64
MDIRLAVILAVSLTILGSAWADRDEEKEQNTRSGYNLRDRNRNDANNSDRSESNSRESENDRNRRTSWSHGSNRDTGSDRNRGSSYGQGSGTGWNQGSDRNNGNDRNQGSGTGWNQGSDRSNGNDRNQGSGTSWNQGSDRNNGNDRNQGSGTGWNQGVDRNNGNDRNRGNGYGQGVGSDRNNGNQGNSWGQGSNFNSGNDRNRETGSSNSFGTNQGSYGNNGNDRNRETGSSNSFGTNHGSHGTNGNRETGSSNSFGTNHGSHGTNGNRETGSSNSFGANQWNNGNSYGGHLGSSGGSNGGFSSSNSFGTNQGSYGGDRNQGNQSNKPPKDKVNFPGLNNKDVKEQLVRAYWPWIDEKFPKPVQSPVDISTVNAKKENLPDFEFENYWENRKEIVRLRNDGHTVQVTIADDVYEEDRPFISGGPLKDDYLFDGMHLHWGKTDGDGSEHTLNGRTFSTEMHIVHFKKEYGSLANAQKHYDGIAVVAFFGTAKGGDNKDLAGFINDLEQVRRCNSSTVMPVQRTFECIKRLASARAPANRYYAYPGSLTTPPYSESVIWIVFPDPFQISSRQLNEFRQLRSCENKALIRKNDRELQPFNNRPVIFAY